MIWVTGALTQDNVESQGTATGRIEAEGEQRQNAATNNDPVNPNAD